MLQEDYLGIQSQVLETSIQISKIVQKVTKEAFRISDEAKLALGLTVNSVLQVLETTQNTPDLQIRQCIKKLKIHDALLKARTSMQLQIFDCTHTLTDQAMQIEKRMTTIINSVRAHIIQAMDSMWLCEPEEAKVGNEWKKVVDISCLNSLKEEGEQISENLPTQTNNLLKESEMLEGTVSSLLQNCVIRASSSTSERASFLTQQIHNCTSFNSLYFNGNEFKII
ncbi:uncharacterized protein LOC142318746 isoform X2 [Lycorma delicatula]